MQSFNVLCAKGPQFCAPKLLLPVEILKFIFNYNVFSTKLYAHEIFGS